VHRHPSPEFEDDFTAPSSDGRLDAARWIDHYLPHWTTPDRSQARYRLDRHGLTLIIDPDQPTWRPEDAPLVVSSVQTGTYSGAAGTSAGIHRHRPDGMTVRNEQRRLMLWAPRAGRVDVTLSPALEPGFVTAAWLVGTEEASPDDCGEICLVELEPVYDPAGTTTVVARTGLKAHGDPRMSTEMVALDPEPSWQGTATWSAQWGVEGTVVSVDEREVFRSQQSTSYPLILLVGLFRVAEMRLPTPVTATVQRVRGWARD
jgi:hypothetical protein